MLSFRVRSALVYLAAAGAWVFLSDRFLAGIVDDSTLLTQLQSLKGLVFIALSAALIYWVAGRGSAEAAHADESGPGALRIRLLTAAALLASLLVGGALIAQIENTRVQQKRAIVLDRAVDHGRALREQLDRSLSATYALAAVLRQGQGRVDNFEALAAEMLALYQGVSSLAIAPGGIVSQAYPTAGSERVIGINILADPKRRADAIQAVRLRQVTMTGPIKLFDGRSGLLGRLAVFLGDGDEAKLWGFVTAVMPLETILRAGQLDQMASAHYGYELGRLDADGRFEMFAHSASHDLQDPVTHEIEVPNGRWVLKVAPLDGWHSYSSLTVEALLALGLSLLLGYLTRSLLWQPVLLRREVETRTRELAEANRRLSKLHQAVEQSPATVLIADRAGRIEYVNPKFTQLTGYTRDEAIGQTPRLLRSGVNADATYRELWQTILAGREWRGELCNRRKNGELFWEDMVIAPVKDEQGEIAHFIAVKEDVTERRQAREALDRLNRTLRVISQGNAALVRAADEASLLDEVGRILVECGGYCVVWVGMPEAHDPTRLRPVMMFPAGRLDAGGFALDRGAEEPWPGFVGAALAENRPTLSADVGADPFYAAGVGQVAGCGCAAGAALPLTQAGETFGVLVLHTHDPDMLGEQELALLQELANDVAYGVSTLRLRTARAAALAQLADSEERFRAISSAAQDAIVLIDPAGRVRYWNPAAVDMFGYSESEALGAEFHELVAPPARRDAAARGIAAFRATGTGRAIGRLIESEACHRDGRVFPVELSVSAIQIQGAWHAVGVVRDIAARRHAEEALRLRDQAIEASSNGIMISSATDLDHPFTYVNPAFERITGYSALETIGRNGRFLVGDDLDQVELDEIRLALREGRDGRAILRNYRKDGSLFWNELSVSPVRDRDGRVTHFVSVINDVTEHKRYEAQLEYQANYDELTGLPNRNLLADRLEQAIVHAARDSAEVAVMIVDLDQFKLINDSLGHAHGDALLKSLSERLLACVRDADTVARAGADEFVLVLLGADATQSAQTVRRRIQSALSVPFELAGNTVTVNASIGISLYPRDASEAQALIKHADAAMFRVKEQGRNGFQFFTAEINQRVHERLTMESQLRRAIENGELTLHYQPQVELSSGAIVGAEALVRWLHPEQGMIPPVRFIPLAEETGLIVPLGEWVMWSACRQNQAWLDAGLPPVRVGVNLSARQFSDTDLLGLTRRVLGETRLAPELLDLELTESMAMQGVDRGIRLLRELKELGLRTSLDDFGTGHSSLSYLRQFSVDTLKIDRSFINGIASDPHNAAIATTIIAMAHNLGLRVIAEGVETQGDLSYLRRHYCDEIQGYFFSKPVAAADYEAMLRARRSLAPEAPGEAGDERTLLLVDDEPNVLLALKRLLRRDGYRILTAGSAREGLDLLAVNRVQVIVSDQRMPEMNGTEFLARVRQLHPDTVRMILSGYTDLKAVTDAINEGAIYKFLTKPWDDAALRETVQTAFRMQAQAGRH